MVKREEPRARYGPEPPSASAIAFRQGTSLALIVLLFSAASPFTPISWIIRSDGGYLFDRLLAGIALLGACYFQWRIAGLAYPLAIALPVGASGSTVRNGRLESTGAEFVLFWRPSEYWPYAICEAVLLLLAEFGPSETVRRFIAVGVVACLWLVGWFATPQSVKMWAWKHIKAMWFWMILNEVMSVGLGRGGGGRRRARW